MVSGLRHNTKMPYSDSVSYGLTSLLQLNPASYQLAGSFCKNALCSINGSEPVRCSLLFRFYFTLPSFSLSHGTGSLSVTREYLGWEMYPIHRIFVSRQYQDTARYSIISLNIEALTLFWLTFPMSFFLYSLVHKKSL